MCLYRGTIPCEVLFVGEGPGESEDALGLCFVGPAGRLLDEIIRLTTEEVRPFKWAVTNIVGCIPLSPREKSRMNRTIRQPTNNEIEACRPRLQEFLAMAKPRSIIALGQIADKGLSAINLGRKGFSPGFAAMLHPAAILRQDESSRDLSVRKCVVTIQRMLDKNGRTQKWGGE